MCSDGGELGDAVLGDGCELCDAVLCDGCELCDAVLADGRFSDTVKTHDHCYIFRYSIEGLTELFCCSKGSSTNLKGVSRRSSDQNVFQIG